LIRRLATAGTALAVLAWGATARGYVYPLEIDVSGEQDIWELFYNEDIDDVDRDRLLELWDRGVDPNRAGADDLYELPGVTKAMAAAVVELREAEGPFSDVEDLTAVLPADVFEQAEPFLRLAGEGKPWLSGVTGKVKLVTVAGRSNRGVEAFAEKGAEDQTREGSTRVNGYLQARAEIGERWDVGVLAAWRERNDAPEERPTTATEEPTFLSPAPTSFAVLDHAFVRRRTKRWEVLLGSYRAGFGRGLTFNTSGRRKPHGFYDNLVVHADEDGAKVRVTPRELGVAARHKRLDLGPGWLDLTAFGSWALRDVYQYDYNPNLILHTVDGDVLRDHDKEEVKLGYQRIAWGMQERLGGANLTYRLSKRSHVGLTGWAGDAAVRIDSVVEPGFAPSSNLPVRGGFGAVGLDGSSGIGWLDVAGEVALAWASCDVIPADWTDVQAYVLAHPGELCGGDPHAVRMAPGGTVTLWADPATWLDGQLDLWYYTADYANPHAAAPMASSETLLGNRNRNQTGGRLRGAYKPWTWLSFAGDAALWRHLEYHPAIAMTKDEAGKVPSWDDVPDCSRYTRSGTDRFGTGGSGIEHTCRPTMDAEVRLRVDAKPTARERVGVEWKWHDEDLDRPAAQGDDDPDAHFDEEAPFEEGFAKYKTTRPTAGTKQHLKLRFSSDRLPRTKLRLEGIYRWYDKALYGCRAERLTDEKKEVSFLPGLSPDHRPTRYRCDDRFMYDEVENDLSLSLHARTDLSPGPKLIGRLRYLDERRFQGEHGDFNSDGYVYSADMRGETSLDGYVQAEQKVGKDLTVALRYRVIYSLDRKDSLENPEVSAQSYHRFNPQQSVLLRLETRF